MRSFIEGRTFPTRNAEPEPKMIEECWHAPPLRAAPVDASAAGTRELGPMPTWNLSDLYPGPQSEAVQADLRKAADWAAVIKQRYQGKLALLAADGAKLAEAIT